MPVALGSWLLFAIVSVALIAAGPRDYPLLHTALDTAVALVAVVLAARLWDISYWADRRLPQILAITLAITAALHLMHMLVTLEWSGSMDFITRHAGSWGPAMWPPATYLLPIGTLIALTQKGLRRVATPPILAAMTALAVVMLVGFDQLPRYTSPGLLGITRPILLAVPMMWMAVVVLALRWRQANRLMSPLAAMGSMLAVANAAALYSAAPHDAAAMIAHFGRLCGHLLLLFAVLRVVTVEMQAKAAADAALIQTKEALEQHVQERTAELVKRTESLRSSESRFRAFVSATSDVIYRMSPDWSEMRQLVGQDFIADTTAPDSQWLQKYIHRDDQPLVMETIQGAVETRQIFQLEHRVLRVDGTLGWTFSRAIPLMNDRGQIIEWFGAASDVTVRREAQERANSQVARLSLLGTVTRAITERQDESSIFQIVIRALEKELPADFVCIGLHDAGENTLSISKVGAASAQLAMAMALPERARVPIDQNGLARCMQGQLVYEADMAGSAFAFPTRLAAGGLRSLVIAPLKTGGKVFGALITARREAASFSSTDCEFLRQLSEQLSLATRQAHLHSALQKAYDDLRQSQQIVMQQERLRSLGQLASGIAHDINNALSPAALYAQSLLETDASLGESARKRLTVIARAIDDVGDTVRRMRMFYRPRDAELKLAPVALNEILQQVLELTRAKWRDIPQEHGTVIELQAELASDLPSIMGAETEIRDALTNLILNAVDAMPQGGTLTVRSLTDGMGVAGAAARALIEISDTGVGMTEAVRSRCLEPFFTTKGERGTGLGLAMVYGMVQRHSAGLEIDSEPGQGTTMRLSFAVSSPAIEASTAALAMALGPQRLLLVDDDPILLQSLTEVLQGDGHLVTAADGGQQGIDEFFAARQSGQPFAVVITDLGMPNIDGRTVATAIKAASPETPVVLLTGWGQRMQDDGERPADVDRVLGKPPKLAELRTALVQLVRDPV
jgi:signal transduction histidine kinase/PAS domain-containing protein/ActR/RegA family two-component response regulator